MAACPACGAANRDGARFCDACGAPLSAPAPERRKLATLLFCDLSGSTAMGERVDAESVRELMFRYFHEMRGAIERHGGTVEKFVGDAVMAVFGVPVTHEDDALRACRAAVEMRDRLAALNVELERRYSTTVALRIGVNTGEVVAGDAAARETFVSGDAVNVAARLEQAAAPGEILLGEATSRLVARSATVEPVDALRLKGKSEPLPAYRLAAVADMPATARALEGRLVGRARELAALGERFERCVAESRPARVVVAGDPGVGKSRLTSAFVALSPEASVLAGRSLSYGEGITYWALAEIVRTAGALQDEDNREQARAKLLRVLRDDVDAPIVAERLLTAIGRGATPASAEEIAWAARRLVSALAAQRPLMLVLDDLHWAEPALLDLLQTLDQATGPVFMLGIARPELFEQRPEWAEDALRLQPLDEHDCTRLAEALLSGLDVMPDVRSRVVETAGGNPLFVEELVAMLAEEGAGSDIPLTLAGLLESRLDRLPTHLRAAAERGSVEGQLFHRGAVEALADRDPPQVAASLTGLVDREVVAPAAAIFVDEAAFQFRHILIRDAAYRGAPKRARAQWHASLADWLERKAGPRIGEFEEIVGYHLDQAYRYRTDLGPVDDAARAVAERAADRLISAGQRALLRGDAAAGSNLLTRARELLPEGDARRTTILPFLAEALVDRGDFASAEDVVAEAMASEDPETSARAALSRFLVRLSTDPDVDLEAARREALETIEPLGGNDAALARAWRLVAWIDLGRSHGTEMERALEHAVEHARRAGDRREELEALFLLPMLLWFGPTPYEQADTRCRRLLDDVRDAPKVRAIVLSALGMLASLRGDFVQARRLVADSNALLEDLGLRVMTLAAAMNDGEIELLAGDPAAAERALRPACEELRRVGEVGFYGTNLAHLAEAVYRQGRHADALEVAEEAHHYGAYADTLAYVGGTRAMTLARLGRIAEAEELAPAVVAAADRSDYPFLRINARLALAEVLEVAERPSDALPALAEALAIAERKGDLVRAGIARSRLAALEAARV
jgi:class 3 adenylate cyclase/tetratricopeptide (TPR) repeat protein